MAGFKITNDVGATVFALLSGLTALFLTAWVFGSGGCKDTSNPEITPIPAPVAPVAAAAVPEIDASRKALAEESARRAELATELRGNKSDLGALEKENASLNAQLKKLKDAASLRGDLTGKLADLRLKLKAANDRNGELATKVEGAASTKAKLDVNIADLQAKLKAQEGEKSSLAMKLKASAEGAGKMTGLSAELAALKLKFDSETKASKEAKSSLLTLKQSAAEKEKALLAQIESLKAAMAGDSSKLAGELKALQLSSAEKEKTAAAEIKALKLSSVDMAKVATELKALQLSSAEKEKTAAGEIKALKLSSVDMAKVPAELKALKLSSADKEKIAAAQLAKLKAEVDALTKKLTSDVKASDDAKKKLMAEINRLNAELDALKNGDKLKRAGDFPDLDLPLLVNDPSKLDAKMRPLFASLRGINETVADREATYQKIIAQGNSSAKDVVQFGSGSAEVTAAERTELEANLKNLGKGVKVLAVGYASIDGDAKSNHDLSSKRASSVAQEVARITGLSAGDVQAVYFGQTKRFNEKYLTPNRVVEIWVTK